MREREEPTLPVLVLSVGGIKEKLLAKAPTPGLDAEAGA
jgi:hypothetical protein